VEEAIELEGKEDNWVPVHKLDRYQFDFVTPHYWLINYRQVYVDFAGIHVELIVFFIMIVTTIYSSFLLINQSLIWASFSLHSGSKVTFLAVNQ